jgi:hypothetical protein
MLTTLFASKHTTSTSAILFWFFEITSITFICPGNYKRPDERVLVLHGFLFIYCAHRLVCQIETLSVSESVSISKCNSGATLTEVTVL